MIGITFSLSGMLVFMLMVMVNDFLIMVSNAMQDYEKLFSHDSMVFKDYEYEINIDKHPLVW
jgi:hypothetical protein